MHEPTFFETPADFRKWLAKHHRSAAELWVGFYKKGSGRPSITW
ncbi:MAG TPA: bacteriocin-protection protein, partial [Thermoanaerobaculia bacterium]